MEKTKLMKQITIWRNDPVEFIKLLEKSSGQKLLWYQKIYLRMMINNKS